MRKKTRLERASEIFPGVLTWIGILWPIIFSFFWPSIVAVYILLFDLYFIMRALLMAYFLFKTSKKMKKALHTDFGRRLESIDLKDPKVLDPKEVFQLVIFATFREELDTLLPSVESVIKADWDPRRKIIVLAGEERDKERFERIYKYLKNRFGDRLYAFLAFEHPDGIEGEVRGKGAGAAWAGRRISEFVAEHKLDESKIIVHIADADTRFHRQFLNAVAEEFCTNTNRHRRTYQPIPLFSNNIWYAHPVCRYAAWGSSFWQMIECSRPWRLENFSTHAYSLKMLREMDYWAVDVVNEDSRQYWRAFFAFDGDHLVVPIYLPVHMDAIFADDVWTTLKNQYFQKRRWAYGVEHMPFIITQSIKNKKIPLYDRLAKLWRVISGAYDWATASFYLVVIGWLPLLFSEKFRHTVLAQNFPLVGQVLLSIAWIGVLVSIYVSLSYLPPRPKDVRKTKYLVMVLDWLIMPVSALFVSSIPAVEAQTRLMLGKYMTFWVTPKINKK